MPLGAVESMPGRKKAPLDPSDPHELFLAGMTLLDKEAPREAARVFELALRASPGEAAYMSYLGLALGLSRADGKRSIELCEKAVRRQFFQAELFHNLGRVYLMSGHRRKAREAFIAGLKLDETKPENIQALESMGIRRAPVLSFLARGHPLNRMAGKALARLGLR